MSVQCRIEVQEVGGNAFLVHDKLEHAPSGLAAAGAIMSGVVLEDDEGLISIGLRIKQRDLIQDGAVVVLEHNAEGFLGQGRLMRKRALRLTCRHHHDAGLLASATAFRSVDSNKLPKSLAPN